MYFREVAIFIKSCEMRWSNIIWKFSSFKTYSQNCLSVARYHLSPEGRLLMLSLVRVCIYSVPKTELFSPNSRRCPSEDEISGTIII